jgi:hypothetical protein
MAAADITDATIYQLNPNCGKKIIYVAATTTNAADYITVEELSAVEGGYLMSTGGLVAVLSFATNVVTFANGATGSKSWSGFVWGY